MDAVVTLWFVSTPTPGKVLATEPKADRGFGRKYLAQLNPAWPITPIGQFPYNRSAPVSDGEFYIAGFPGLTLISTKVEDLTVVSEIDETLLSSVDAPEVYVFAFNDKEHFGGFAHFTSGVLKRAFTAQRDHIYEDTGLPVPFEAPFWAGERGEQLGGINLPFDPVDIVKAAESYWLDFEVSPTGTDIQVVGYAIDGRPEPKLATAPAASGAAPTGGATSAGTASAGLAATGSATSSAEVAVYDDYEVHRDETSTVGEEFAQFTEASAALLRRFGRWASSSARSVFSRKKR